jgi:hypothetical protein
MHMTIEDSPMLFWKEATLFIDNSLSKTNVLVHYGV